MNVNQLVAIDTHVHIEHTDEDGPADRAAEKYFGPVTAPRERNPHAQKKPTPPLFWRGPAGGGGPAPPTAAGLWAVWSTIRLEMMRGSASNTKPLVCA